MRVLIPLFMHLFAHLLDYPPGTSGGITN
jgi:hypothetical protein